MADGNHANYAKVGFIAFAGVAAVLATLVFFGGMRGKGEEFLAETYYDSAVSGLSVGSEVNFRGVKVGEVRSISFIGADYPEAAERDREKVRIVLAFNRRLVRARPDSTPLNTLRHLIRKGVRATVSASGITGLSKIELDYPLVKPAEPPKPSWTPQHVCIPPMPSILESFADSATKVMNHLNGMDLATAGSNLTETISAAAAAASGVAAIVKTAGPCVAAALEDLESASRSLKDFAEEIRDEPSLLLRSRPAEPLPETER